MLEAGMQKLSDMGNRHLILVHLALLVRMAIEAMPTRPGCRSYSSNQSVEWTVDQVALSEKISLRLAENFTADFIMRS